MADKSFRAAPVLLAALIWLVFGSPVSAEGKLRVLMLGDSLTAGCDWQARLPQAEVVNQGISGDSTWHILDRLVKVVEAKPDMIFLQAGINDFGKKPSPESILERHKKIWSELREKLPETRLYVVSLLPVSAKRYPRWGQPVVRLNQLLNDAAAENGLTFVNVYSSLSGEDGDLPKKFTYDGLHLLPPAYDLWTASIRPYVDEALAADKNDERIK